jgi:hypothetical protein
LAFSKSILLFLAHCIFPFLYAVVADTPNAHEHQEIAGGNESDNIKVDAGEEDIYEPIGTQQPSTSEAPSASSLFKKISDSKHAFFSCSHCPRTEPSKFCIVFIKQVSIIL